MTSKPSFALLLSALTCLYQISSGTPLNSLHNHASLHDGAHSKLHLAKDLHSHQSRPQRRDLDQGLLEDEEGGLSRRSDNESSDAAQDTDASWLHDHSTLEDSDLDQLLDELGLSYTDVRELVKRYAGGDPVCTSTAPTAATPTVAPPQSSPTGPSSAGARNMNIVYYAQTPATAQVPLTEICADPTIDVVILSFITDFYSAGGYPTLNLAAQCWAATAAQRAAGATGLIDCVGDGFASQVASCQQAGKKVMLSVGGAIATNNLPNAAAAVQAAQNIWGLFLGGNDPQLNALRPFGPNIKLDGIDIDNEAPAYATYIPDLVKALRAQFATDPSKRYYLSAAPQCPRPDQSIPMPQIIPDLDWVLVQFYNNPSCNLDTGTAFLDSLRAWSQDLLTASGSSSSPSTGTTSDNNNFGPFLIAPPLPPRKSPTPRRRSLHPPRAVGGPKLFIGLLATPGSGYVDPSGLQSVLDSVKTLDIPNLGGVMYWDGAYQALSGNGGAKSYAQVVRETLA